jgi:Predicted exporters of the RND superfamily
VALVTVSLLVTAGLATGIPNIQLQTDFQASLPQDLDPIQAEDRVEANFGSTDAIIVLFETDSSVQEDSYVTDVRDPRLLRTQRFLAEELEREEQVASAQSAAALVQQLPNTTQSSRSVFENRQSSQFFNRDFTASLMFVELSSDTTEDNIVETTRVIEQNLEQSPQYPGVDTTVSGLPVVRADLGQVLVSDSATTTAVASVLILGLLTVVRGRVYGPITFVPLAMGLIWTLGALGWLGIPLTIATIALGSLILGLGVEYGSFMTERIVEELENHDIDEAVATSVSSTGKAIIGSSTTTIVGFAALILASISFIRNLGLTLALGIALTLTAAVAVTPALIVTYERWKS